VSSTFDPQAGQSVAPAKLSDPAGRGPASPSGQPLTQPKLKGARWWREVGWRHIVGGVAIVFAVFPILYIISAALNPLGSVVSTSLIPTQVSLVNFEALFGDPSRPFLRWLLNTFVVCTIVTFVQVFCSALAACAFSRFRFAGRRLGLLSLLLIQLFP